MKLNLVKDEKGQLIATFENPSVAGGPAVKPLLQAGQTVVEIEAAENYKADLATFYKQNSK
jgi:hypothetical protein